MLEECKISAVIVRIFCRYLKYFNYVLMMIRKYLTIRAHLNDEPLSLCLKYTENSAV